MNLQVEEAKRRLSGIGWDSKPRTDPAKYLSNNTPYWQHSTTYYTALAKYLEALFGRDNLEGRVVVDIGCGAGWGVLFLREELGVDAYGIDRNLEQYLYDMDEQSIENIQKIRQLYEEGKLISEHAAFALARFDQNQVDALTFVYWSNIYRYHDPNAEDLTEVLKKGGYILLIAMDEYPDFLKELITAQLSRGIEILLQPQTPKQERGSYILQKTE